MKKREKQPPSLDRYVESARNLLLGGQPAFWLHLREVFDEPGAFTVELSDEMLTLTTKQGSKLIAFVREVRTKTDEAR